MNQPDRLTEDQRRVFDALAAKLPEVASIMNGPAVTETIVFGPDSDTPENEEDLPPQEVYDRDELALGALCDYGLAQTHDLFGMVAYSLTAKGVQLAKEGRDDA